MRHSCQNSRFGIASQLYSCILAPRLPRPQVHRFLGSYRGLVRRLSRLGSISAGISTTFDTETIDPPRTSPRSAPCLARTWSGRKRATALRRYYPAAQRCWRAWCPSCPRFRSPPTAGRARTPRGFACIAGGCRSGSAPDQSREPSGSTQTGRF